MRFDLIIFDCDGVLVDSEPLVNRVFVEMLGELGYRLDYEATLREFSGAVMSTRLAISQQRLGWSPPAGFTRDFERRLLEVMRRDLQAVPGIREALDRLRRPWCVVSNGTPNDMRFRLGLTGLLEAFEPYLCSASEVARPKPAPDVFLYAARAMGVSPERCAIIEDSVPGVHAGVEAGMAIFGFARLTSARRLQEAGAWVFERMVDLPTMLEGSSA
ncbi:MAG TPA: HAD family hydrolase [Candidatus Binatia bacterium]|nr:HAD family hydrolase [Candidatus Binatia bacterium]